MALVECSHGVRVQDALSHADGACREAKTWRHARLVTYRKGAAAFEERAAKELMLVETLGQNRLPAGLFLVMQPIMSLARADRFARLRSAAALARAGRLDDCRPAR